MGTLDLVTKVNFSTIRSPLRIGGYLGNPVGTLGVLGFDMEPVVGFVVFLVLGLALGLV